jgi:hypothetical protein
MHEKKRVITDYKNQSVSNKLKRILLIIIGVVTLLFLSVLGLDYFFKKKLKEQINQVPESVKIQYEDIKVNSLKGSIDLVKPLISIYEKTTHKITIQIELKHFSVVNLSYWNYLFNDKITLYNIFFSQPKITYYHNNASKFHEDKFIKDLKQIIQIEFLQIQDAHVKIYDISNDSLLLKTENLNLRINTIEINPSTEKKLITYKDFKATSKSTFYSLNDYENLIIKNLDVRSDFSSLKGITLKTKYSKETLSNKIEVERDHYNLTIDSIKITKQNFGFEQDTLFYFKSQCVDFYQPNFKIYRNKLVTDNLSYKPLYSKMLRDLNFSMTLNSVFLNNASVTYTEKVKTDTQGGKILFSKLNGEIKNLSNTYEFDDTITSINITAVFMDNTPIDVQWNFDINNLHDQFIFKAKIGKLNAESMNQFMESNLNMRVKGEIDKTYFTINGNNFTSQIDLKLKYDDFDVFILKENGKVKNKVLSNIISFFISKDSNDAAENFRYGSKSEVKRTMNRSVFNYFWLNIKAGLLDAMTRDGKEK